MITRYEFEQAVVSSELDGMSRTILFVMAFHKNWKEDGKAFPAIETIVKETGFSHGPVARRIPKLREAGWLVQVGFNAKGTKVYDLSIPTPAEAVIAAAAITTPVEDDGSEGVIAGAAQQDCWSSNAGLLEQHTNKTENMLVNMKDNTVASASASAPVVEDKEDALEIMESPLVPINTPAAGADDLPQQEDISYCFSSTPTDFNQDKFDKLVGLSVYKDELRNLLDGRWRAPKSGETENEYLTAALAIVREDAW